MRDLRPQMEERLEEITEAFYQSVVGVDKLKKIIVEHSTIERLKQTLKDHLLEIWNGDINEAYVAKGCALPRCISAWGLSLNGTCPLSRTYRTNSSR